MKIEMRHHSGVTKSVKLGFSWITLFWGWIPSSIRGHWSMVVKLFLLGWITLGIYPIYKSFNINKDYKEWLMLQGFEEVKNY